MKVKITLDCNASSSNKSYAVQKIHRELGSNVSISGDVITVDDGSDERKLIDILNHERIDYSRSTYYVWLSCRPAGRRNEPDGPVRILSRRVRFRI